MGGSSFGRVLLVFVLVNILFWLCVWHGEAYLFVWARGLLLGGRGHHHFVAEGEGEEYRMVQVEAGA